MGDAAGSDKYPKLEISISAAAAASSQHDATASHQELETDHKDQRSSSKFDYVQSYVTRLLEVSSVFDDEVENNVSDDDDHHRKIRTWNSQYHRGGSVVVVAKDSPLHRQHTSTATITATATCTASQIVSEKPLLLPVRSLKSQFSDHDALGTTQESSNQAAAVSLVSTRSSSSSGSTRSSSSIDSNLISRTAELEGARLSRPDLEEREEKLVRSSGSKHYAGNTTKSRNELLGGPSPLKLQNHVLDRGSTSVVHHSPIPWRSRLARTEMKEDVDGGGRPLYPATLNHGESTRLHPHSSLTSLASGRMDSISHSPKKLSPSPSSLSSPKTLSPSPSNRSAESQAIDVEDVRKKSFHRSSTLRQGKKQEYVDKVTVVDTTTDEDEDIDREETTGSDDDEDDYFEQVDGKEDDHRPISKEELLGGESDQCVDIHGDGGPDVDKKADEFIAKFREQIRFQRIESMRRSSGHHHLDNNNLTSR